MFLEKDTSIGSLEIIGGNETDARINGFDNIDVKINEHVSWCDIIYSGRPCFSLPILSDFVNFQNGIYLENQRRKGAGENLIKFNVLGTAHPRVFSLGGDLGLFISAIKNKDKDLLQRYARRCIEAIYNHWYGFGSNVITIALVQGSALGGGMECAMSSGIVIAERGTQFGLPETLFSLFPGMGAYPFLAAKLGMAQAEKIILSGRLYSAEEMYEMGLVNQVVEPGSGVEAVSEFIQKNMNKYNALASVLQQRRRYFHVSLDALLCDISSWVDTAMALGERDVVRMSKLVAAQTRLDKECF